MNSSTLARTFALGAITGMRSMAGPAALGLNRGGALRSITTVLAAGEMIADKTPGIGARIAPGPLAARAVLGAIVGGAVAAEERADVASGVILGAASAVAAAYAAYYLRKRLAGPSAVGGVIEDALVVAVASRFGSQQVLASDPGW